MPDGKICYLEIPALDIAVSAAFYAQVFGWKSRLRGDGHRAFDDTTGAVSGSWVLGRPPSREAGILTYVMVDRVDATLAKVSAAGGRVATPLTPPGRRLLPSSTRPATCSGSIRSRSDDGSR